MSVSLAYTDAYARSVPARVVATDGDSSTRSPNAMDQTGAQVQVAVPMTA